MEKYIESYYQGLRIKNYPHIHFSFIVYAFLLRMESLTPIYISGTMFGSSDYNNIDASKFSDDSDIYEIKNFNKKIFDILTKIDPYSLELTYMKELYESKNYIELNDLIVNVGYNSSIEEGVRQGARHDWNSGGGTLQPEGLTRLMLGLAVVGKGAMVYNPFGGMASIGMGLTAGQSYYGQELDDRTWALATIRLSAHPEQKQVHFVQGNSVTEWNPWEKRFDLIIANPPMAGRLNLLPLDYRSYSSHASYFLIRALESVKKDGMVVALLPTNFLSSSHQGELAVRKRLVDEGILDTVVVLPGGLMPNTNVSCALIMLDRSRGRKTSVRMVDAKKFVERKAKGLGHKDLNDAGLLHAIKAGTDPDVVRQVPNDEIRDNDYSLVATRYFMPAIVMSGFPLRDIAKPLRLERMAVKGEDYHIRVGDLKDNPLDGQLLRDALKPEKVPANARLLSRPALLLAMRGGRLKPTWFHGESVTISSDILALHVDEEKVFVPYLVHELHTPTARDQMARLTSGATVPKLTRRDLLGIRVELPTIEEQRAKVKGLQQAFVAAQVEQARRSAEQHGIQLQRFGNTVSFKHLLGTPLVNLGSGVRIVRTALEQLHPDWRKHVVIEGEQETLGDIVTDLDHELRRITALLKADSVELDVEKYDLGPMDLVVYARETSRRFRSARDDGHKVSLVIHADVKDLLKGKAPIHGNKDLLDIAIDALVNNAKRHAFAGEPKPHKLQFHVGVTMEEHTFLTLTVSNSGKPFPEGFGLDRFVRKNIYAGKTGHTGIGGYHVQEVVQRHNGRLDLRTASDHSDPFTTAVELSFPLTH